MEKEIKGRGLRFERREILKLMTSAPALALVSAVPLASRAAGAVPPPAAEQPVAASHPKALTSHEWRTLRILADQIIPADEQSGSATQAGVPEFIDDWLALQRGSLLDEIRGGLTWLDMECQRAHQLNFADCSPSQQERILDRIAYPAKAAREDAAGVAFFNTLRDLVVSGFFTSQMGIRDLPYVGNEPQSAWWGCPGAVLERLGVGKGKAES